MRGERTGGTRRGCRGEKSGVRIEEERRGGMDREGKGKEGRGGEGRGEEEGGREGWTGREGREGDRLSR